MSKAEELDRLKREIVDLSDSINKSLNLDDIDEPEQPLNRAGKEKGYMYPESKLCIRNFLRGHFGKIYALNWASPVNMQNNLVSASQDGKLIIWNAFTTNKIHAIPLKSSWVMTCAYSPDGELVACGGLDNICSVYKLPAMGQQAEIGKQRTFSELAAHEGYLSSCRCNTFMHARDGTCIYWDVVKHTKITQYFGHSGDVMSLDPNKDGNVFISGSVDGFAKLWDIREQKNNGKCACSFVGHESDINAVQYFPDNLAFGTASDDSTCRLFDTRASSTSVTFSNSGKKLFAGYDDYNCYVWNTIEGKLEEQLTGHENRVSCVGMHGSGNVLCTGSWDTLMKLWS